MQLPISLIIIAKNAAETISGALQLSSTFKETIVLDNASTDNTVSISKRFTQKVYSSHTANIRDLRNEALQYATQKWVLFLDSDEIVQKESLSFIEKIIKKNGELYDGFWIARRNYFGSKENDYLKHGLFYPDYQLRLFKKGYEYINTVHEEPNILKSRTYHLKNIEVYHYLNKKKYFSILGIQYFVPVIKMHAQALKSKNISILLIQAQWKFFDLFFISLTRGKGILDGYYGIIGAFNFALQIYLIYIYAIYFKITKKN